MSYLISMMKRHRLATAVVCVGLASAATWAAETPHVSASPVQPAVKVTSPPAKPSAPLHSAAVQPTTPQPGAAAATSASLANPERPVTPVTTQVPAGNDALPLSNDTFYAEQTQLQYQIQLLKLQSEIADLHKKINDASDAALPPAPSVIAAPPAALTPQNGTPSDPAHGSVNTVSVPLPGIASAPTTAPLSVTSVLGVAGHYTAQVKDHGVNCTVTEGSVMSDGWRVDQIAPSTVVLVRGRARRILHVSN